MGYYYSSDKKSELHVSKFDLSSNKYSDSGDDSFLSCDNLSLRNIKFSKPFNLIKETPSVKIKINEDRFEPGHVLVSLGTEVEWSIRFDDRTYNNSRRKTYVISFNDLGEESDPIRTKNDKFRLTFKRAGVFEYRCSIQTRMRGTIEVVGGSEQTATPTAKIQDISALL